MIQKQNKDFCQYADVFYGNGAVDHFPEDGLASKWFYIKALCGNTTPHAVYPFGKMSVGTYSGGYPTGYGTHYPSSCGGIKKLSAVAAIRGFSHLHQSGIGAIRYYYNYAVTTPFYGSIDRITDYYTFENETAHPGYYSVEFNDIFCELTVNETTAFHRYHFKKDGGRVAIDFSNDGLSKLFGTNCYAFAKDAEVELTSSGYAFFSGVLSGIKLYFCALLEGKNVRSKLFRDTKEIETVKFVVEDHSKPFGVVYDFDGDEALVKVSYSTLGYEQAKANVMAADMPFEETADKAYEVWNQHLSAIDIQTEDEELRGKFYSNFYHTIIKPTDMSGESVLGIRDDLVVDFSTLWDQYKTALPLIYMLYPEISNKIVRGIENISRTLGKIPCSLGLSTIFSCEEQAKMLGILTLCDAYHFGIQEADQELISDCIKRELAREDFQIFLEKGIFERYTHIIDTTDACLAVAEITEDSELQHTLLGLSKNWINAYDEDGLMSMKSPYYEGDRYTYSFRLQKNMEERIALAGGKEAFVKMLDDFFGFGKNSLKQLTYLGADEEINAAQHHRFEGFNNECDMETPYAYIYADRHDRTCDIVHESIYKTFTTGKGALPGNNDSGGLSSCFMWNVLGLFPASGTGEFLLGKPHIDRATITLSNGKVLVIENLNKENCYVNNVIFNGQVIQNYRISINQLMNGGTLTFS